MIRVRRKKSILPRAIPCPPPLASLHLQATMSKDAMRIVLLPGLLKHLISSSLSMDVEDMERTLEEMEGSESLPRKFKRQFKKLSRAVSSVHQVLSASISFLLQDAFKIEDRSLTLAFGPSLRRPVDLISIRLVHEPSSISTRPNTMASPASQLKKIIRNLIQINQSQPRTSIATKMFTVLSQPTSSPLPIVPDGCILIQRDQQMEAITTAYEAGVTKIRRQFPRKIEIEIHYHDPFASARSSEGADHEERQAYIRLAPNQESSYQVNRPIKRFI